MKHESHRRRMSGVVVSSTMDKTVIVRVNRVVAHPKYGKRYTISRRYKAHDGDNSFKVGDAVVIEETRPLSKDKRWRVISEATSS